VDREQKKKLVLETWQAIAVGNVKAAFANLSDGIRWKIPGSIAPISGIKNGKGEILEFLRAVSKIFPPAMRSEIRSVYVDGDAVIVEMVNRSTTASGRPYENEYCFVFEISDGKIREIREYVDTQRANEIING
jgi:ketosteroid isomerase-like protein